MTRHIYIGRVTHFDPAVGKIETWLEVRYCVEGFPDEPLSSMMMPGTYEHWEVER